MPLSATISTGLVKGRFGSGVVVGPNGEKLLIPARGRIDFEGLTPFTQFPTADPPVTMLRPRATGILDSEGYLCTPDTTDPSKPGERMVLMQAPNDPDSTVRGWTWRGTPRFVNADGTRVHNSMEPFTFDLPFGDVPFDLVNAVSVPESAGVGTEQVIILAASAQAAATSAAGSAEAAAEAARAVAGALPSKADLIDGKVPADQLPPAVGVTDEVVAPLVDMPETAAKIDARVAEQVAGKLDADTAAATFQTKTDAAGLAERLGDATTAEGQVLAGTYATIARPASINAAKPLASHYDPRFQLYNFKPAQLAKSRAKMAQAAAGTGKAKIAHIGDSITFGLNADKLTQSYPARIRAALTAKGYPSGGTGPAVVLADKRWAFESGWSHHQSKKFNYQCTVNGSSATFTSDVAGPNVTVRYRNTGAFTVSVDGYAPVSVAANSSGTIMAYTVTNLPDTKHAVTITAQSAFTYICDVNVYRNTGLEVANFGLSGSTTVDWTDTAYDSPFQSVSGWSPDLVTIKLGTNDKRTLGLTAAQYKANVSTIITRSKGFGADVVIISPIPNDQGNAGMAPYNTALYELAEDHNVPLIDMAERLGSFGSANTNGLMSDGTHPNAAGYEELASAILDAIFPNRASSVVEIPAPAVPAPKPYELPSSGYSRRYLASSIPTAAGTLVPGWADSAGSGVSMLQPSPALQPIVAVDAAGKKYVKFDGMDDTMDAAHSASAPVTVTFRARMRALPGVANLSWQFGSFSSSSAGSVSTDITGKVAAYGTAQLDSAAGVMGSSAWRSVTVVFNGASSLVVVDQAATNGNTGSLNPGRIHLARIGNGAAAANPALSPLDVQEVIVWPVALTQAEVLAVHAAQAANLS